MELAGGATCAVAGAADGVMRNARLALSFSGGGVYLSGFNAKDLFAKFLGEVLFFGICAMSAKGGFPGTSAAIFIVGII